MAVVIRPTAGRAITWSPPRAARLAVATCGSVGLCRAGCTDSELPLEKDSEREGTGGSSTLPVCLDWASGELWLVLLNLSSTCITELEDMTRG